MTVASSSSDNSIDEASASSASAGLGASSAACDAAANPQLTTRAFLLSVRVGESSTRCAFPAVASMEQLVQLLSSKLGKEIQAAEIEFWDVDFNVSPAVRCSCIQVLTVTDRCPLRPGRCLHLSLLIFLVFVQEWTRVTSLADLPEKAKLRVVE